MMTLALGASILALAFAASKMESNSKIGYLPQIVFLVLSRYVLNSDKLYVSIESIAILSKIYIDL